MNRNPISTDSQRGSIILYAMLTMSVMLAIGLTLNSLFISKLRQATAARNTMVALYAADSAAEACLYSARTAMPGNALVMQNGATFAIISTAAGNPDITGDCSTLGSSSFGFRATGTFRGVSRTLEINQ